MAAYAPQQTLEPRRIPMKKPNSPSFETVPAGHRPRTTGFTLVELLVVIVIIAALAALSMVGLNRAKFAAAKAQTVSQLRQVSLAVTMWAAEKNAGEPMYAANGTGDYGHESFPGAKADISPGNPAKALFNPNSPDEGYLTDHTVFFSPLAKFKVPERKDYKPDETSAAHPWGTYAWHYPSNTELTTKQNNAMGGAWAVASVSNAAKGKLLMANEYTNCNPIWQKQYVALMIDGSVSLVAQSQLAWDKWAWNK